MPHLIPSAAYSPLSSICFFLLIMLFGNKIDVISGSDQCTYIMPHGLLRCHFKNASKREHKSAHGTQPKHQGSCSNSSVCGKHYNISLISFPPFSRGMNHTVMKMFEHCCPNCSTTIKINHWRNISEVHATSLEMSTFVFPILARTNVDQLHGFHFLPFFDAPSAFYVIRSQSRSATVDRLLNGVSELWPLLCASLLLTLLSGFIAWILDTWINEEEFPRAFLIGLFEGFWWSFISMTTVGYGDKAPKSRIARLFSVVWILLGISIVSMLTATLTNVMSYAESGPSTDMAGKTVGTLMYRSYDAAIVAKHGGIIDPIDYEDVINGIDQLLKRLFDKDDSGITLDGFLIDKHTYYFYLKKSSDASQNLLHKTLYAEKRLPDEEVSYGMLLKHKHDFNYFKRYMDDNWLQFDACQELRVNNMVKHLTNSRYSTMTSAKDRVFYPVMKYTAALMVIVGVFGVAYELRRRKVIRVCAQQKQPVLENNY